MRICFPSGENATQLSMRSSALNVRSLAPVEASHNTGARENGVAVRTYCHVNTVLPSGENPADWTFPSNVRSLSFVTEFHRIAPSIDPVRIWLPPGENATEATSRWCVSNVPSLVPITVSHETALPSR